MQQRYVPNREVIKARGWAKKLKNIGAVSKTINTVKFAWISVETVHCNVGEKLQRYNLHLLRKW